MRFGILEPPSVHGQPPGTVLLKDAVSDTTRTQTGQNTDTIPLKHVSGKPDIVLAPQPSEDPNDPLNWPQAKKIAVVSIILYGSCICASTIGPLLNSSLAVIAGDLGYKIGDITLLSGYQLLVCGATGPLVSALGRKFGKRPVMLVSSLFGLIGTIIGSTAKTYNTLLAARITQGFSISAYESLIFPIVGDIFFLHERGFYTTLASFILTCVSNLSSVVAGAITQYLGWPYVFHILNAVLGSQLILCFFFVPETSYIRDARYEVDQQKLTDDLTQTKLEEDLEKQNVQRVEDIMVTPPERQIPRKKTFREELSLYSREHQSKENFLKLLIAPFVVCSNIGVLWMVIVSGVSISFYVAVSYVTAQIFAYPPYNLNAAGVGFLSAGPAVGGLLGSAAIAFITDPLAVWQARRNHGIFEPEFRLVPMVFGLIAGAGLFGFGAVTQLRGNMYLAVFLWSMNLFGVASISSITSMYVLDSWRHMSSEIFIANMVLKNFLFYGYSYFVNEWVASAGPGIPFYVFGAITFFLVLSTIPIYMFGKMYRGYWSRHNVLDKLNISTHTEI